jgi:hypothetical protein
VAETDANNSCRIGDRVALQLRLQASHVFDDAGKALQRPDPNSAV